MSWYRNRALMTAVLFSGSKAINITSFTQSLGAELLTNGDFNAWTADDPDGWNVVGESGSDPEVSEVDSGESHGGTNITGGSANLYSSAGGYKPKLQQSILTANNWYEVVGVLSAVASGTFYITDTLGVFFSSASSPGNVILVGQANYTNISAEGGGSANDQTLDSISVKKITPNVLQDAFANNNGSYAFRFTLLGSPVKNQTVWLNYRVEDATNRWQVRLKYDGTNWNVYLDSVSSGTATNRITVNNVGTPTMIGVYVNGDDHKLFTGTGDSIAGATWTQRGGTITNTTHNTANQFRPIYHSAITPLQLYASTKDIFS